MVKLKLSIVILAVFVALPFVVARSSSVRPAPGNGRASEAPAGFDDASNGLLSEAEFRVASNVFMRHYFERDGLGPVFNGETCLTCHQFPVTGGFSLNTVTRVGKFDGKKFVAHPGGLVLQVSATRQDLREQRQPGFDIVSPRLSTSMLGLGFVEAISDNTLRRVAREQAKATHGRIRGAVINAPVLEAQGKPGVGRFGWKSAHASLLSFVAEAFINELGMTSDLYPDEITAAGKSLAAFDKAADPEIDRERLETVTRFIRATKAPPRDESLLATPAARAGEKLFAAIGCAICHLPTIQTSPVGARVGGGAFVVPEALGNKIIHPYSDFLLHDVGTGDGIVEVGGISTRNKLRTAPLWGLGARVKRLGEHLALMHDGASKSLDAAILRHAGAATEVTATYRRLPEDEKAQLIAFLKSL